MTERITITIETRGAAFTEAPMAEVARILRRLANRAERDGLLDFIPLHDANGNRIGKVDITVIGTEEDA